ncbi:hypothetical protein TUM3792_07590 [Shewanella sp. MBTL60-007]|nr:hypothetical protein TUM3792_07590 [Shewanella sp. MBTL60-007]
MPSNQIIISTPTANLNGLTFKTTAQGMIKTEGKMKVLGQENKSEYELALDLSYPRIYKRSALAPSQI